MNPLKKTVMVYDLEQDKQSDQYGFEDIVSSCIHKDLEINIADLLS